ncbi:hypothetical protein V2H45_04830 [Tumidithrix elongata RA019]|uniref:Uncharacterized protein n=1 Tax=Tumidithrix elongata BACA0141 TaxID=2716417 RepID=A0AAW9PZS0_9CYAN|nr:hypothetical protein [Tumidithrix elongata RA019]
MEQQFKTFQSVRDAYELLQDLGASAPLVQHVKLVGEAAESLEITAMECFAIADGLICDRWGARDSASQFRQMGLPLS